MSRLSFNMRPTSRQPRPRRANSVLFAIIAAEALIAICLTILVIKMPHLL